MRVPKLVVVGVSVVVMVGVWWVGVRKLDFMTPPSEGELEKIRLQVVSSIPVVAQTHNAVASPQPARGGQVSNDPAKPMMEPGNFMEAPAITEYRDQVGKGFSEMIELAEYLESQKQLHRALLVWERVIDSSRPSLEQWDKAISEVKRLRAIVPQLNRDPKLAAGVVLHVGVAKRGANALKGALDEVAKQIEQASSGVLRVRVEVSVGDNPSSRKAPIPVAIWLTGDAKGTVSSELSSFMLDDQTDVGKKLTQTVYESLRAMLERRGAGVVLPELLADAEGKDALTYWITRAMWVELGKTLNTAEELRR